MTTQEQRERAMDALNEIATRYNNGHKFTGDIRRYIMTLENTLMWIERENFGVVNDDDAEVA